MAQEISAKYTIDLDDFFSSMDAASDRLGAFDSQLKTLSQKNPIAQFAQQQQAFNQALGQQIQIYRQIEATQESFRREVARLEREYEALNKRRNEFIAAGRYQELQRDLTATRNRINEIKTALGEASDGVERVKKSTSGAGDIFSKLKDYVIGAFAVDRILAAGTAIVNTTGKFEKYEAVLTNALGSRSVAQENLRLIADYAANSPSQVDEVTEAFVKLANRGLVPTKEQLINIGDLAASQGKGIDQLTEAILDAQSGEFERLKEFGIRASKSGDQVTLAFKGTSQTVKATSEDITEAILKFGQLNGVAGSTAAVSKTLEGQMSNFSDQVDRLSVGLGNSGLGGAFRVALQVGGEFLGLLTDLVTNSPAEDLRKQQLELNGLVGAIALANDNEQVRLGLIQQLNQKYPEFLGKLNAEAVTTDLLAERLRVVNGLYEQKIRIALGQEKIKKVQDELTASIAGQSKALQDLALASGKSVVELEKLSAADQLRLARDFASGRRRISPQAQEQNLNASYFEITVDILERRGKQQIDLQKQLATLSGENAVREARLSQITVKGYQDQIKQVREKIRLKQLDKKLGEEEIKRLEGEIRRAEGKPAVVAPTPTMGAKTKKTDNALKAYQEERRLLLDAQQDYQKEALKLEEEFGKDRLSALDKDGEEYINLQAEIERKALQIKRDAIERSLQLSKSNRTAVVNGRRQVVANTSVTLENSAPNLAAAFAEQEKAIEQERVRQLKLSRVRQEYELLELAKKSNDTELALFDKQWEAKILAEKDNGERYLELIRQRDSARSQIQRTASIDELNAFDDAWKRILESEKLNYEKFRALIKKRDRDRNTLIVDQLLSSTRNQQDIELAFTDTDRFEQNERSKDPSLNAVEVNEKRERAKLQIRIKYGEETLKLLKEQGEAENALLITQTQATVDGLKKQLAAFDAGTPRFDSIFDLIGLTDGFDETQMQAFQDGMQRIGESIMQVTSLLIQQSEERIRALDSEIAAKEEQVKTEEERNKEGSANNLKIRKQELDDLKRQKAEEERVRRNAVRVQQALDIASSTSSSILTTQKAIEAAVTAFSEQQKLGPIVGLVAGLAAVATVIATIVSIRARIRALTASTAPSTQLREGGRIPLSGRTHERGGHRIEGTDIEVERGEWVTNAKSSEKYHDVLDALNQDNPQRAFQELMAKGFGLPEIVIKQISRPDFVTNTNGLAELKQSVDAMGRQLSTALAKIESNTKPGKQIVPLASGKIMIVDGNHTSVQDPPK